MSRPSALLDYLGRIEVIHLAERTDRYARLDQSLSCIGIDIKDPRVQIPDAPIAQSDYGFPSRQVYGNFLSHLDILKRALLSDAESVLVLEDDAIFRSHLRHQSSQCNVVRQLKDVPWDIAFLGHPISEKLASASSGIIKTDDSFKWAHCYAVKRRVLPDLVEFLEASVERPAGHPDGGKLYIDGALSMFRKENPDIFTVVHNPTLSIQSGSPSGIAARRWYDKSRMLRIPISIVRRVRDDVWRISGLFGTR